MVLSSSVLNTRRARLRQGRLVGQDSAVCGTWRCRGGPRACGIQVEMYPGLGILEWVGVRCCECKKDTQFPAVGREETEGTAVRKPL